MVAENILAESENGEEYLLGNANYSPRDADGERVPDAFIGGEGGRGPVRVDIFETRAHAVEDEDIRVASGAGYYGALGLTGGLFERVVSLGSERGRAFRGSHGDGTLSYSGLAANTAGNPDAGNPDTHRAGNPDTHRETRTPIEGKPGHP